MRTVGIDKTVSVEHRRVNLQKSECVISYAGSVSYHAQGMGGGASSGQVGKFFELLRTPMRQGLRTWVAVRHHHQRGSSMALEYLTRGSSTGDDIWMSRYNTPWNRAA